ncbi:528_t:CDS:2 [Scutellospora calospora]|uniref:528_t:CDS:1 n=1 Tax=Scutellospora calospora TaxID=85575 RepID=A0ACA9K3V7_9GLOM|nr:528_t:CDS:2 [Scutellospora calospora]
MKVDSGVKLFMNMNSISIILCLYSEEIYTFKLLLYRKKVMRSLNFIMKHNDKWIASRISDKLSTNQTKKKRKKLLSSCNDNDIWDEKGAKKFLKYVKKNYRKFADISSHEIPAATASTSAAAVIPSAAINTSAAAAAITSPATSTSTTASNTSVAAAITSPATSISTTTSNTSAAVAAITSPATSISTVASTTSAAAATITSPAATAITSPAATAITSPATSTSAAAAIPSAVAVTSAAASTTISAAAAIPSAAEVTSAAASTTISATAAIPSAAAITSAAEKIILIDEDFDPTWIKSVEQELFQDQRIETLTKQRDEAFKLNSSLNERMVHMRYEMEVLRAEKRLLNHEIFTLRRKLYN